MKTIAQALPENALNEVIAQAPQGMSAQEILEDFPDLDLGRIYAALA